MAAGYRAAMGDHVRLTGLGPDGRFEGASDEIIEVENPARLGEVRGRGAATSVAQTEAVVAAAHDAWSSWRSVSVDERADALRESADAVGATAARLGPVLAGELGKIVEDCRGEMGFAAAWLHHCATRAPDLLSPDVVDDDAGYLRVEHIPYGVCAAVVPWNAPLILAILKVGPAIACGNTVVVKPSPLAPLAVTDALEAVAAHLPPGVLNVVHGGGDVGGALVSHPLVRKVSFTGGNVTAPHVLRSAAEGIRPVSLELGGNDAAIVCDDVEFDDATMERLIHGSFLTSGQVCMAAKRIFVGEARRAEFVERYEEVARDLLVVGDPMDPGTTVGPVISRSQRDHVTGLVDDARRRGGSVIPLGRMAPDVDPTVGWFLQPTLVDGTAPDWPIVATEQFGPTVPVVGVSSDDEAIRLANDDPLGLAASVWSTDTSRAIELASRLDVGMTFVNCHNRAGMSLRAPFGGVRASGFGREFGDAGILEYRQTHSIHLPASVRDGATAGRAYPT